LADRQHRPRRLALALTRASGLAIAVTVTTALLLVSPTGSRGSAEVIAERELLTVLEPGERVLAQVTVAQRRSADVWQRSYGILAATSRRLIHVSAAPRPLLRPADPGPRELRLDSWPYDSDVTLDGASAENARTLTVRTATRVTRFRTSDDEAALDVRRAVTESRPQREDARPDAPPRY
jgi:hypothetical protein